MINYFVSISNMVLIYCLLALSLNLQWGFTGLINFGHVAFFAVGAYASAILTSAGVPILGGIVVAMIAAALFAWPIGFTTIRLRTDYLAIVTLGFGEALRIVAMNEEWLTGGTGGIVGIPNLFSGTSYSELAYLATFLIIVILVFLILQRLVSSPFGRVLKSIRADEYAAQSIGKNTVKFKIQSFVIGAAIAGLAGSLYAHYMSYISPDQFVPLVTFNIWIAVMLGGTGNNKGAILGTGLLFLFLEGTRFLTDFDFIYLQEYQLSALRFIVVGLAMVALVLYRPNGILGRQEAV